MVSAPPRVSTRRGCRVLLVNDDGAAAEWLLAPVVVHRLTGGIPRRINTLCNRLLLAAFLSEKHILNAADVQAIALEINEELGHDLVLQSPADATIPSTTSLASPPRAETRMWHMHFEKIEERIDRLEKTVGAAVDLLHGLLHPEKAATKPGKSSGS